MAGIWQTVTEAGAEDVVEAGEAVDWVEYGVNNVVEARAESRANMATK